VPPAVPATEPGAETEVGVPLAATSRSPGTGTLCLTSAHSADH
jgi:hypothetical protein